MDLILVKFLSGEIVLAENMGEVKTKKDTLRLKNPVVVLLAQVDEQNVSVQFRPICPFTEDKEIDFNINTIVYMAAPVSDMANQYKSLFGGIVLAKAGDVPSNVVPFKK
jgi:hypothetical protein